MKRSSSSCDSNSLLGRWDDDSNRPHKRAKDSPTDDATSNQNTIPESDLWVVTRFLGQGSYGSVYLAESTPDGDEALLPYEMVVKSTDVSQASRLKQEEKFLTRLKSPFVVSCYGHEITEDNNSKYYNTLLEYCPRQCLAKHIIKGKGLPEEDVKEFAMDILLGLKYIHGEKIIHCDIKPKNILLSPVNTRIRASGFSAKISGFGKAMEEDSIEYGEGWGHRRGTTRFMSPELIRDMFLDYGADVWAFGCTVLEMLTGELAWGEHGDLDWEDWITVIGESNLHPYFPESLSEDAKDFLYKCLEKNPVQRCSVDSLMKHRFLSWNHEEEEEEEEVEVEEISDEEEETEQAIYDEIGDVDVEANEANLLNGEDMYDDEIGDADVEANEANLLHGEEDMYDDEIPDEEWWYEAWLRGSFAEEEEEEVEEINEEEEEIDDEIGDADVEAYEANLVNGEEMYDDEIDEEEEATVIDEEYPVEDEDEEDGL